MPSAAEDADLAFLRFLEHCDDVGMIVERFYIRHAAQRAKSRAERLVFLRRQGLIAEEDDEMFEEGPADLSELPRLERPREIDTADLGAKRAGERAKFERRVSCHRSPQSV